MCSSFDISNLLRPPILHLGLCERVWSSISDFCSFWNQFVSLLAIIWSAFTFVNLNPFIFSYRAERLYLSANAFVCSSPEVTSLSKLFWTMAL